VKIGLLGTQFFGCPPSFYGGAEMVNWYLSCGLAEKGHKVILYAPDNSQIPPGGFLYKTGPPIDTVNTDWFEAEKSNWMKCKHTFSELDVLLGSNWFGFEYASKREIPDLGVCHVHHGHLNEMWVKQSKPPFNFNMIAISNWMKNVYHDSGFESRVCHNGIDLDLYPLQKEKTDRFLFLGRIDPIKGVHLAIEAALKSGVKLDVVGATSFVTDLNYVERVKGMCDGEKIRFIGEVSHEDKVKYLQDARGLIVCSQFGEPLGLMSIEALSCGTPVVALRDGGIPEVVDESCGFICEDVNGIVDGISRIESVSADSCRKRAEVFSKENMTEQYVKRFKEILSGDTW